MMDDSDFGAYVSFGVSKTVCTYRVMGKTRHVGLSSVLAKSILILPLISGPCTAQVIGLYIGLAFLASHQSSLYRADDWSVF